ncbi:MAG: hypothetical protein ABI641_13590 [Caldimonas sp.]
MRHAAYTRQRQERVHVIDANAMPWENTPRAGLRLKSVRLDDSRGEFLGLIGFDAFTRSGLHQHQGIATSFILEGGLTDYHGPVNQHEVGINYRGSTHDAVAWVPTVLVSKLEGPVTYPMGAGVLSGIHAGSRHENFRNPDPAVPPEVNVAIDALPRRPTGVAGLMRQDIYDYAHSDDVRRMAQWHIAPETEATAWQASDWVELWVRGGEIAVNDQDASANCFVIVEPGATVRIASAYGALVLAWAEGRERWPGNAAGDDAPNLFGF